MIELANEKGLDNLTWLGSQFVESYQTISKCALSIAWMFRHEM
jgi:hypothetical protein